MPAVKTTDMELWRRGVRGYIVGTLETKNVSRETLAKALRVNIRTLENKINNPETFWMHEMVQMSRILKCPLADLVQGNAADQNTKATGIEDVIVVMSDVLQILAKVVLQKDAPYDIQN